MIRLPPTGVSLSHNDINFHLQQIGIYHGLLKQGFSRHQILRYFHEHQAAQTPPPRPCSSLGSPSLTAVELAARASSSREPTLARERTTSPDHHDQDQDQGQGRDGLSSAASHHIHSAVQAHQHVPRQSSLLRFTQVLASSSPPYQTEPASDTHLENQAERSESQSQSQLVTTISRLHLGPQTAKSPHSIPRRWAEAEPFVPASQRNSVSRSSVNDIKDTCLPSSASAEDSVRQEDAVQPDQISSSNSSSSSSMPSSPPNMPAEMQQHEPASVSVSVSSSPTLPPMPVIDEQHRGGVHTEPRLRRGLQMELSSFPVFNDGLPIDDQPQTPRDLSRYLVTEEDAAYTAPPGALYTASPTRRPRAAVAEGAVDYGDQSPVALAMDSRERRARELIRGVRAERMRLQRQLLHDRDIIAQGLDGGLEAASDSNDSDPTAVPDFWRDDWEDDRVGDENWEGQLPVDWLRGGQREGQREE